MASSSLPSWVILGSVPRVCAADTDLPKGADLSLALAAPPRLTLLTIPRHVAPDPIAPSTYPFVLAADPSGLLLHTTQGRTATKADNHDRQILIRGDPVEGYFVADACTAIAFRLSDPALGPGPVGHHGNLGLLLPPRGCSHYMIVELHPDIDFHEATLFCFSSYTGDLRFLLRRAVGVRSTPPELAAAMAALYAAAEAAKVTEEVGARGRDGGFWGGRLTEAAAAAGGGARTHAARKGTRDSGGGRGKDEASAIGEG